MHLSLTIKNRKPRNPFVAASRRRHAGAHRTPASGRRQREQRSLRDELSRLDPLQRSP